MNKSDDELKAEVENIIESEATIDSTDIRVFAELGFVNLDSEVSSLEEKLHAEELVMQNTEAKGVFNYLVVRPEGLVSSSPII